MSIYYSILTSLKGHHCNDIDVVASCFALQVHMYILFSLAKCPFQLKDLYPMGLSLREFPTSLSLLPKLDKVSSTASKKCDGSLLNMLGCK